ncbi:MAG: hypothetical protein ACI9MR_000255 [Myxococcota bacterium]|jgi:hypothetical protein
MRSPTPTLTHVFGLSAALLLAGLTGCPDDGGDGDVSADTVVDTDDTSVDSVDPDGTEDSAIDSSMVDDTGEDVVIRPEPGVFVLGTADLSNEYVFKGVWAGEVGRIVAVGNEGVVASRDPEGAWSVLTRAEGAEILNAVHGVNSETLFAVGKNGAILNGSVSSFGESGACDRNADCDTGDACTIDVCINNVCTANPSGLAGCCGATLGQIGFEGGDLQDWTVVDVVGGATWQVVERANRASEGASALWFGNPSATPPSYETGLRVTGTAQSGNIALPTTGTAMLMLDAYIDTEPDSFADAFVIEVQAEGAIAEVWNKTAVGSIPTNGFRAVEVDLSQYRGSSIRLRFRFDSQDAIINNLEGVYLDNVRIESACAAGGMANQQTGPTYWGAYALSATQAYAVGRAGAIQSYDGASWGVSTTDTGSVWNGLWGNAAGEVALVGNSGKVSATFGGVLTTFAIGTTGNVQATHSADGATFWAVGDQGLILRGTAAGWASVPSGTNVSLRDVLAISNDDVYAVGFLGTLLHYDGQAWAMLNAGTSGDLHAVWADASGSVTVSGTNGEILTGSAAAGFTSEGVLHPMGTLLDIWGTPDGFNYAVGSGGRIVSNVAGTWSAQVSGTAQDLLSVFGFGAADVWAVGRAGTILHYDGVAWTRTESPSTASINAVWGYAPDRVFAAGSGGTLLQWDGTAWGSLIGTTTENLRGVFGIAANDVWAVGANATVMHFGGIGWAVNGVDKIPTEDGEGEEIIDELHAVWAAAADDAWAVGAEGRIIHFDGTSWSRFEHDFTTTLRGIYGLATDDIWAVGNEGLIIHYNGEDWTQVPSGSIATLHHIHGDGVGHVVVVGSIGTVLTLDRDE